MKNLYVATRVAAYSTSALVSLYLSIIEWRKCSSVAMKSHPLATTNKTLSRARSVSFLAKLAALVENNHGSRRERTRTDSNVSNAVNSPKVSPKHQTQVYITLHYLSMIAYFTLSFSLMAAAFRHVNSIQICMQSRIR